MAVNRDQVGKYFQRLGIDPRLEGTVEVTLVDGQKVPCRTVFDVTTRAPGLLVHAGEGEQDHLDPHRSGPVGLARQIAANLEKTLFVMGMGPNQYFNSDLKDRACFLVAALTRNIGRFGGNVGSYAGNYRASFFSGLGQYIGENPFDTGAGSDSSRSDLEVLPRRIGSLLQSR